jgi:hypothetical protein
MKKSSHLIKKTDLEKFSLQIGIILACLGFLPALKGREQNFLLINTAFVILTLGLIKPNIICPLYLVLTKLGNGISKVSSFLVLSLAFYFVISPMAILKRLLSPKTNKFSYRTGVDTYWIKRELSNPQENMKRIF